MPLVTFTNRQFKPKVCVKLMNPKLETPLEHPQNRQYFSAVQKLVNIYKLVSHNNIERETKMF